MCVCVNTLLIVCVCVCVTASVYMTCGGEANGGALIALEELGPAGMTR